MRLPLPLTNFGRAGVRRSLSWAVAVMLGGVSLAAAPAAPTLRFDIPAGPAIETLKRAAQQSGCDIMYLAGTVQGVTTHAVKGEFTPREALDRMVADTRLKIVQDEKTGALTVTSTTDAPARAPPSAPPVSSQTNPAMIPKKKPLAWIAGVLALVFAPVHQAPAAEANTTLPADAPAGAVSGTVSNAATGAYLEGAQVVLEPGGLSTLTARDGRYTFPRVAPGEYRMMVSYTGLDPQTIAVTVRPAAVASNDVGLTSDIYKLSAFVVEGEREGNALAVTQQRNAPNVKNVISSDAFGNVADLNLANFLMRIPGFSTEISEGEIMRVQIRGTSANLNSFSIDGTRGANGSTRTYERGADIDRISADFIETIEVTKAPTPDIDADSIGGAVNMKTKSALDRKGRRINYSIANNYNVSQKTSRPLGSFGYSDLILGARLGILVTGSYNETNKPRDCNTVDWDDTTATDRPVWFNANAFGRDQIRHKRSGASVRFDYKLGATTRLYVSVAASRYDDQLNRRWIRLANPSDAAVKFISPGVIETSNQTFTFYQLLRNRDVKTWNYGSGLESKVFGGNLDATVNYSWSHGTDLNRMVPQRTVAKTAWRQTLGAPNNGITIEQIGGPDISDWKNSALSSFDIPEYNSTDEIIGGQVNFRRPLAFRFPFALKTGVRAREQTRSRDNTRHLYSYVGPDGVAGPNSKLGGANDDNLERFWDRGYDYVPNKSQPKNAGLPSYYMDMNKLSAEVRDHPEEFKLDLATSTRDTFRNDTKSKELVSAGYVMGEMKFGRLGVVTGVRVEDTRVKGKGYKQEITPEEKARRAAWGSAPLTEEETIRRQWAEYGNRVTANGGYTDLFPSIHLKYLITPNFFARLSYSTGIGRPNFGSIIPTQSINNDAMTISANNPGIKPQYSDNYDATLEYYFRPAGMVSIAGFEKRITDFIFRSRAGVLESGNPFGEEYVGYTLSTDMNGGYAVIRGLEASYQQQFTNLPGFWAGFGVFANFTWLETRGDYGKSGTVQTQSELPNFTPRTGNVGVSYIRDRWTVRVMANHTGRRLIAYSTNPANCEYQFATTPIDISVGYAFNKRLRLFADVIDVFNVGRQNQYLYVPERKSATFVYSTVVKVGLSGSF